MRLQIQPKFWQWIHWLAPRKLPLNRSHGKVHNPPESTMLLDRCRITGKRKVRGYDKVKSLRALSLQQFNSDNMKTLQIDAQCSKSGGEVMEVFLPLG